MKKVETNKEETALVKMLYVTSSLLLDSPYVRLLHTLVTDKVSGGDISYYMELARSEDGDNFQLREDGYIDRSFYEARKARVPQTILMIVDSLYSEIVRIAKAKAVTNQELWKNCNFMSLKAQYSKDWDNFLESDMKPKSNLIIDGVNLSLLYDKQKMLFSYSVAEDKGNNIYLFMVEALFWLSCVGMCELYFYIVCMLKKSKTVERFSDFDHPNHEDLFLNPTAKNLKRYLASVDLSKDSMHTLNQIETVDDYWVHLYNVFHPFSILISDYENHLTWRLSVRSRKFVDLLGLPSDPSNEHWLNTITFPEKNQNDDDKNNEDSGDENEQYDGYDRTSGVIDDYYQGDDETKSAAKGRYGKVQNTNYESINTMRDFVVRESQASLKAFPLFNALKNYKLKGGPINLIGYINKIAKNELTHQATKKDGIFSTYGYYKEKYGTSKRTIQRAKQTIKDRMSPKNKHENIEDIEIYKVLKEKDLKKKHSLEGYWSQNEFVSKVIVPYFLKKEEIEYNKTTIRNIVKNLREENLITAIKKGQGFYFKTDDTENSLKILNMVEQAIKERKINSKKNLRHLK